MKDIGEKLRLAREKSGISIDEASEDLNYKVSQLEDIETGNYRTFKDKFILKTIISDYAKYLGLDGEALVDEFNEFLFDFTSKIPLSDIEKAKDIPLSDYCPQLIFKESVGSVQIQMNNTNSTQQIDKQ